MVIGLRGLHQEVAYVRSSRTIPLMDKPAAPEHLSGALSCMNWEEYFVAILGGETRDHPPRIVATLVLAHSDHITPRLYFGIAKN